MGVQSLWSLLHSVGRPVRLESLSNKVLAIDASIWFHQFLKAMRDAEGQLQRNAHILGFLRRICKLLYFRVKPVFVFDGGVPSLKRHTIQKRRQQAATSGQTYEKIARKILKKQSHLQGDTNTSAQQQESSTSAILREGIVDVSEFDEPFETLFNLSKEQGDLTETSFDSDHEMSDDGIDVEIDSIDMSTIAQLPLDMQHDILLQLREQRNTVKSITLEKIQSANSTSSDQFSRLQLDHLFKRHLITKRLQQVKKELSRQNSGLSSYSIAADDAREYVLHFETEKSKLLENDTSEVTLKDNKSEQQAYLKLGALPIVISEDEESLDSNSDNEESTMQTFCTETSAGKSPATDDLFTVNVDLQQGTLQHQNSLINLFSSEEEDDAHQAATSEMLTKSETSSVESIKLPIGKLDEPKTNESIDVISRKDSILLDNIHLISSKQTVKCEPDNQRSTKVGGGHTEEDSASDILSSLDPPMKMEMSFVSAVEPEIIEKASKRDVIESDIADHSNLKLIDLTTGPKNESEMLLRGKSDIPIVNDIQQFPESVQKDDSNIKSPALKEDNGIPEKSFELSDEGFDTLLGDAPLNEEIVFDQTEVYEQLEKDMSDLKDAHRRYLRDSSTVSDSMLDDCQELLRLFGIPYVIAPLEAEAQCAHLEETGKVQGIITDDSDVFLFGGRAIYKNVFNQQQLVECFLMSDLERELTLTRDKLIQLALLLGSDYTDGIQGVGVVLAMEILKEFPNGLQEMKEWYERCHLGAEPEILEESAVRKQLRKKELKFPDLFPDTRVVDAYLHPRVNDVQSRFEWALPDVQGIRDYIHIKLHWSAERVDQLVLPIMKKLGETVVQSNLHAYFAPDVFPKKKVRHPSKRIQRVLGLLEERKPPVKKSKGKTKSDAVKKVNSRKGNRKKATVSAEYEFSEK